MKKVISTILPLIAASFLFSCGNSNQPISDKYFTVTFDADEGTFVSGKTVTLNVIKRTGINELINMIREPKGKDDGYSFAYYTYPNDEMVKYGDIVTNDITLKANYLHSVLVKSGNLDDLNWKDISGICTGGDPDKWFKIGATKTVNVHDVDHLVRIIGIHHDKITNLDQRAGLTFEFVNVISKDDGANNIEISTVWDTRGNNYDFPNSDLNEAVANVDLSFEDGLEAVVLNVDKKVACGKEYDIKTYSTKLFPLSWEEIGAEAPPGQYKVGEGTKYSYYDDSPSYQKRVVDGDTKPYWLRSPFIVINYDDNAARISAEGIFGPGYVTAAILAFSPAFCV